MNSYADNDDLVESAKRYAIEMHGSIDHKRKYTGDPYHVHLAAVAELVASVGGTEEMIAAAWLHDIVEDTAATHEDVEQRFGDQVALLVRELTDVSRPQDGNRAIRKAMDREHLAKASIEARTIKLADLLDNAKSIVEHGGGFARVFMNEMRALLKVLHGGEARLYALAQKAVEEFYG